MLAKASKHRLGAAATWSQSTDLYTLPANNAEISAFKYNLMLTVFDNHTSGMTTKQTSADTTGKMKFGTYFPTDRWNHPDKPNEFPIIPDYMSAVWTQSAIDVGFNVVIGGTKVVRYPNHGQQLFDVSGGLYGYDAINGVAGQVDVLNGLVEHEQNWIKQNFGYYPASGSYRNGRLESAYGLGAYLGVRNSAFDVNDVGYDFTREQARAFPTTARQGDMTGTRAEILSTLETSMRKAITENGWFRDFTHWHTIDQPNELYEFFESQRNVIGTNDVISLDYGTALQHKILSDMATVSAVETNGGITVNVSYDDPYGNLPLRVFNIPLSVEVDTTGSILAGKEIKSNVPIRKKSANVFVVEAPFNNLLETVSITLQEAIAPTYITLTPPAITSSVLDGGILTVKTDKAAKLVLFEVAAGAEIFTNPEIYTRNNTLSKTHAVAYTTTGKDLYIGVVDEYGQSSLSAVNAYTLPETQTGLLNVSGLDPIPFYDEIEDNSVRISINGSLKGFKLVNENVAGASNLKIYLGGEVKAFTKFTQ